MLTGKFFNEINMLTSFNFTDFTAPFSIIGVNYTLYCCVSDQESIGKDGEIVRVEDDLDINRL